MARQTITHVTDDLDGSKDAEEVRFSFDGIEYRIDLGKKNKAALHKALSTYINAATKVPARGAGKSRSTKGSRRDLAPIREWAKKQGISVSDRGRVSKSVIDQYNAAH